MKSSKIFISANDYLLDSFKLARQIMDSHWLPDVMIALWRGGAPVGVTVHEFFHYHALRPRHYVLKCHSYTGILERQHQVTIDNIAYLKTNIKRSERVLIVDDIFDSGSTARAVLEQLTDLQVDLRFAAVYWKPKANLTNLTPDYYVRTTDEWIVFPHELDGLSRDEILAKDPQIHALLAPPLTATPTTQSTTV